MNTKRYDLANENATALVAIDDRIADLRRSMDKANIMADAAYDEHIRRAWERDADDLQSCVWELIRLRSVLS